MSSWLNDLSEQNKNHLTNNSSRALRPVNLCAKHITHNGNTLINLASNDYLAYATNPTITSAMQQAISDFGNGSGASPLVTGHLNIHQQAAQQFASFKSAQSALLCPTGYMANLAAITGLLNSNDTIFLDKLNHASIIDAAKLSGATIRIFPHLGYEKLERLLQRSLNDKPKNKRLIVTDSVFSMDGDIANLPLLCKLRDQYQAILMIDEAHGTGVLGHNGSGLAEHQNVLGQIDITVSTCGKALGILGGIITTNNIISQTLINQARPYIYATAIMPAQAAGIIAALNLIQSQPEHRQTLQHLSQYLRTKLQSQGWDIPNHPTPIIPLILGDEKTALSFAQKLENEGFLIPAIRPPTVPKNTSRIRITLRSDVTTQELDHLANVIGHKP